ncbi:hypothetical protein ABT336_00360 [Micromonospora sp. NPDC000207]|uniref:hypothetical protein n=1 Tax=Micromonospora sp. NPDC000207 TaxID=3154246 RepID=UPI003322A958
MTAPAVDEAEAKVTAGLAWLDQNHPGWPDRIDLDVLDIEDPLSCVLGQTVGDFWLVPISYDEATAMGFEVPPGDPGRIELTEAWRRAIEERQLAGASR